MQYRFSRLPTSSQLIGHGYITNFLSTLPIIRGPSLILNSIYRPFSPSKSNESWDDDGLPKIPTHEIFNPPKDQGSIG